MKFTVAAVSAALVGSVAASYANVTTVTLPCDITTTSVVTAYTTYCPEPTTIVEGNKTITVTAPGTVTITDCPCTKTSIIKTSTVTTITGGVKPTAPVVSSAVPNVTTTLSQGAAAGKVTFSGAVAGAIAAAVYFL